MSFIICIASSKNEREIVPFSTYEIPQIIPCLSYCPTGIMVISMRSTRVKQEPNLSFVAAKIQQNCTGTGNYNSKATRQGIICECNNKLKKI